MLHFCFAIHLTNLILVALEQVMLVLPVIMPCIGIYAFIGSYLVNSCVLYRNGLFINITGSISLITLQAAIYRLYSSKLQYITLQAAT